MSKYIYDMDLLDLEKDKIVLDVLIMAKSQDPRAYCIINKYLEINQDVLLFDYSSNTISSDVQLEFFSEQKKINLIKGDMYDPSSCMKSLDEFEFKTEYCIGIDISCFTIPFFFYIIRFLRERVKIKNVIVLYTEPKAYKFVDKIYDSFRASSGPLDIVEIQGFSGYENRASKRNLVVFIGFDGDLSREIEEDVSPNKTIIVNGFPSYLPKYKDVSLFINEKIVAENKKIKYIKANNPFNVYNLLKELCANNDDVFVNIAPLGTKPMALGVCMYALHHSEVRVVYPVPKVYDQEYAIESWRSWLYKIPLFI